MNEAFLKDLIAQLVASEIETKAKIAAIDARADERHAKFEAEITAINAGFTSEMAAINARADERQKKADERHAKFEESMERLKAEMAASYAKTEDQIARTNEQLGGMARSQGDVAEDYFCNAFEALEDQKQFQIGALKFDHFERNFKGTLVEKNQELDALLINGSCVAIVEIKYKAALKDVKQVLTQRALFKKLHPEFDGYQVYAGLAALSVPERVIAKARQHGLFVLKQQGDMMVCHTDNMTAH